MARTRRAASVMAFGYSAWYSVATSYPGTVMRKYWAPRDAAIRASVPVGSRKMQADPGP